MSRLLRRRVLAALGLLVLAASCTTPYPGYRHEGVDPDERLSALLYPDGAPQDRSDETPEERERRQREERRAAGKQLADPGRTLAELRALHLEHPGHVPTLFALAVLEREQGSPERASGYLDGLFDLQPVHPEAAILRSRIAIDEGNLPASRRVLEQQIRYTPDHAGLHEALSATAYLEGGLDEARRELELARRLGAPYWRVAFHQGLIEEAAGNRTQAIKAYEVALLERPDFPAAASRLAGLRAIFGDVVR